MKSIFKKLALLAIPVLLWLAFFIAFEPNNYFGLKASATSSQPVARVRAYQQDPGTNLILGDSRLAHFDMDLVDSLSGHRGRTSHSAVHRYKKRLIWPTMCWIPGTAQTRCSSRSRSTR